MKTFACREFEGEEIGTVKISEPEPLGVERFQIRFEAENIRAFLEDPDRFLHKLIECWNRFPINSIRFRGDRELASEDGGVQCYHVVSPEAERSNTVCF
jgi:hypothetical protein